MKFAIIVSKKDIAGMNIASFLEKTDFRKYDANLFYVEKDTVFSENLDQEIEADLFIFATRHQSEAGKPSLSVHTPGNWTKAEYGGQDRKLCINPPFYIKKAFLYLNEHKLENFEVTLECTHHGPYLEKPCFFIEIGSKEEDWKNKQAAELITNTIIKLIKEAPKQCKIAIGIGGPHYCNNFNKIELSSDIAMSHIVPKHMLDKIDKKMIQQAIEKTDGIVDLILLDWKGLGTEKEKIKRILDEIKMEVKRTSEIEK